VAQFNVIVATDLTQESLDLLKKAREIQVTHVAPNLSVIKPHLKDAHAVIIRDDIQVDASFIESAPNLKLIACVSINLNNVDIQAATTKGILVMNTPGVSALAAGEHTLALMLALSRRLVSAHNSLKEGYWLLDRSRQAGVQIYGKTIGIIGLGRVGSVVAMRCLSFGMTVLAFDPYVSEETVPDKRIQLVGLRDIYSRSDFISVHVPSTRETQGMLDADAFAQMKNNVRILNTSHGGVLDEVALADALKSGKVAGAALDVYREIPPYNNPLIGMDNVIHTPHIGDNTSEALKDVSLKVVEQLIDALRDEDYRNVVNLPLLPGVDYNSIRPFMRLAECMGTVLITLARSPIRRVAVQGFGEDLVGMIKPITVGILKGLLMPIAGDNVSAINAPILANERGWQITQTKGLPTGEYSNNVSCEVTLEDGEKIVIAGTLLDHREPHIVQINHYRMNFIPEGYLLLMGSFDKPGVIGKVGTLLSARNVNIASWHTGRTERGGNTLTVLTLDEAIPDDVLEELRALDFIRHAHQMRI
jgi:D-3-phosphoglycerate dehydrogenase / 2-oxoglutarate reductase